MRSRLAPFVIALLASVQQQGLSAQEPATIRVGGRTVEYVSAGAGSPTVVLESGGGIGHAAWRPILDELAKRTHVIAYSRAGMDGSDPSGDTSPAARVEELRQFLRALGETDPVVVVGWSYGGLLARLYVSTHPDDVSGLVVVDGTHEALFARIQPLFPNFDILQGFAQMIERLPPDLRGDMSETLTIQTRQRVEGMQPLPDLPLAVVTGQKPCPPDREPICQEPRALAIARELQSEWFDRSTNAIHIVSGRTGHNVMADQPGLILLAVDFVLAQVRAAAAADSGSM